MTYGDVVTQLKFTYSCLDKLTESRVEIFCFYLEIFEMGIYYSFGKFGFGKVIRNDIRPLEFCGYNGLLKSSTVFVRKMTLKITW